MNDTIKKGDYVKLPHEEHGEIVGKVVSRMNRSAIMYVKLPNNKRTSHLSIDLEKITELQWEVMKNGK